MNEKGIKILSTLLFDIFKYKNDPKGENDFLELRKLYRDLPLEIKRQITKNALMADPELEVIIDTISQEKNRYLHLEMSTPETSTTFLDNSQ